MTLITDEQVSFYHTNGFVTVSGVVPDDHCDYFYNKIRKYADSNFSAIMNPDRFDFLLAQSFKMLNQRNSLSEKVSFIDEVREVSYMCRNLLRDRNAYDILSTIQQKEVCGLMTQMLFKEAFSRYATQAWQPHQDNAYPKNKNGQYITTNFFLSDAKKENGSLYAYKRSHLGGLYEHEQKPSYREKAGTNPGNTIPEDVLKNFERVDLEFKKGDMLILHGNCIHGSYPNHSDTSRPLFSCSYISKGEEFIAGNNAQRKIIKLI